MKEFIKNKIRESLLTEKLTEVNDDVDFIYDSIFKNDIDEIVTTGIITSDMFKTNRMDTSQLKSEPSVKANGLNHCEILFNFGYNYYKPSSNLIQISINTDAVGLILSEGGKLNDVNRYLSRNQASSILLEFKEEKIKGSIHHELTHWIDDTLNNKHIANKLNKASENGTNKFTNLPINAHYLEIQAQIHNIVQLKRKHEKLWDNLTFDEMLGLSPTLNFINYNLVGDIKAKWRRKLKERMYREGLLGKEMGN